VEGYVEALHKYARFGGRSRRKEYWFFALFNFLIGLALGVVDVFAGLGFISLVFALAVFLLALAVTIRRLHDTGRSGWWVLFSFVPVIGFLVLLFFMVQDSEAGANRYGPNPKEADLIYHPGIAMT